MQNNLFNQNKLDVGQLEEYINYAVQNGRYKPTFYPASNHNPDNLTGKIGQEFKGVRNANEYFSKKYIGYPQPIDKYYIEHRNNFNDFYFLGKDYNPFQEYKNQLNPSYNNENKYQNYINNSFINNNYYFNNLRYNNSKVSDNQISSFSKNNNFDLEKYKRRIMEKEKYLFYNSKIFQKNKNKNLKKNKSFSVIMTPKIKLENYCIDNCNNNKNFTKKNIQYGENGDNPCKIIL